MFEPGRVIAGNAGVLLTEVIWVKPGVTNPYVIVDAAMNDLARPALYDAWHDFVAVRPTGERMVANIAGPVCESGDTFAMGRDIDTGGVGRPRGVPHRRRLWRDDGVDLQQPRAGARGAGRRRPLCGRRRPGQPETLIAAERVPDWLLNSVDGTGIPNVKKGTGGGRGEPATACRCSCGWQGGR